MNKAALFILILLCSGLSNAKVNTRNGSYVEAWVDFIDPQPGYEMKIKRYYSSRSLFLGVFGFGWCTNLETYISITSDGILNLTECGGGLEITYYPENFDKVSPQDTINKIIKSFQRKKAMNATDVKNLRTQLTANTKMRFEYANRLFLVDTDKIKNGKNTFQAKAKGVEKIYFDGNIFERRKHDGSIERFNRKGQLIQRSNSIGQWMRINYKGKLISYLVDNKGRRINFSYGPNEKLKRLYNGRGHEATYSFHGDNLASVKNIWQKTYVYHYDSNHNLIRVDFPDKTFISMSYDLANDWISRYTNRLKCVEKYEFSLSKSEPKNHYWADYSFKCPNSNQTAGRHEFWYKSFSFSKDKYLHRVQETYQENFKDLYFHPYLGRPISIRTNVRYQGFAYYLNGLINKKEDKLYTPTQQVLTWHKWDYDYNFKKLIITSVERQTLNNKGKTTARRKVFYEYNKLKNLTRAFTKKDEFVKVSYNSSGKISKLSNNKGINLSLNFKTGSAKPHEIYQSDLGKVAITYNTQGEVEEVKSLGNRNIATSVVENFLSLLDFLGPLGDQLEI